MRSILTLLVLVTLADPGWAADGVLEINQTCATQTGCFSGDLAGLPVTITAPGSYVLTGNLLLPDENTRGISIGTSNVTVDLAGFEVRGVTTCSGTPLVCSPEGSGSGVSIISATTHEGVRVMNGTVVGTGRHGVFVGPRGVVEKVHVTQNANVGMSGFDGSVFRDNIADLNGFGGIFGNAAALISGNDVSKNGGVGITASADSLIRGNVSSQNEDDGVRGLDGVSILDNTSHSNGDASDLLGLVDGIQCGSGCIVRGNTVRGNSGFGLRLETDSAYRENVVTNNTTGTVTGAASTNNKGNTNHCAGTGAGSAICP